MENSDNLEIMFFENVQQKGEEMLKCGMKRSMAERIQYHV
jgi:hypothetical protein